MAKKKNTTNYRELYEEHYNIKIPDGFVIHHIDGNRMNNNINNLLMLPLELHARYHFYLNQVRENWHVLENGNTFLFGVIHGLGETLIQCDAYIKQKEERDREIYFQSQFADKGAK